MSFSSKYFAVLFYRMIYFGFIYSGNTKGKDISGNYSFILKKIPLPIVESNICQTKLQGEIPAGSKFRLDPSFICAGGIEGIDTCRTSKEDGAAPLVCILLLFNIPFTTVQKIRP